LVETAKANGLEPYAYLCRLFKRLPHAKAIEDLRGPAAVQHIQSIGANDAVVLSLAQKQGGTISRETVYHVHTNMKETRRNDASPTSTNDDATGYRRDSGAQRYAPRHV
jgi:hypothetical protein